MQWKTVAALALCSLLAACAAAPGRLSTTDLREQVFATERAFAQTMADRDLKAFAALVAEEAVFFSGSTALRGRQTIVDAWTRYYKTPAAPFSWEPDQVEVLDSGTLALSSGPVRDGQGKVIARFSSIWRREAPGTWRIIFDKGSEVCSCQSK